MLKKIILTLRHLIPDCDGCNLEERFLPDYIAKVLLFPDIRNGYDMQLYIHVFLLHTPCVFRYHVCY